MIELRHLRYFVAVAEELNFRRAAERIHIDQTPLSRAVRDLEDQLGVPLFVRAPRRLSLTPAGVRMLEEARELFIRFERAKKTVREADASYRVPLRVAVTDGIAQPKLLECFARWRELVPETPLDLHEMSATELLHALRREDVDVGFSFGAPFDEAVAQDPAWSYPIMALVPLGHELALISPQSVARVVGFPLIVCNGNHGPGIRRQMDAVVTRYATTLTIAGEAGSFTGFVTQIGMGLGVGLADSGSIETMRRSDVVAVALSEAELITTYVLYKCAGAEQSAELQRFLAQVRTLG